MSDALDNLRKRNRHNLDGKGLQASLKTVA